MFAKKNLIAVAALATLAVSAQAQSSVTLYGNVDVAVGRFGEPFADSVTEVRSSVLTESFFGLKGQEDLGGGLKAVFKLESSLAVDTGAALGGTGNFFDKNATIGVVGSFGTLTAGRQESLFKQEAIAFNPLGASSFSPTALAFGVQGDSWSNTIGYVSPNMGGLTLSAQYAPKEGALGDASNYDGSLYAVSANYTAGALALSVVYGQTKPFDFGVTLKDRTYLLGASYDFGVVKAFAQYAKAKTDAKGVGEVASPTFYQIGAIVPVTAAGSVHVSFGQNKDDGWKDQAFTLAYNHNLSKRTGVYAGFERVKEKNGGASDSANSFAVGVRHAF